MLIFLHEKKNEEIVTDYGEFFGAIKSEKLDLQLEEENYLEEFIEAYAAQIPQEKL